MDLTSLYRRMVLGIAANQTVSRAAARAGLRLGASRFVAGRSLDSALQVAHDLNRRSVMVTLDHLGEGVAEPSVARAMGQAYCDLLDAIAQSGANANVSLKLTQMGLAIDPALAFQVVAEVVQRALQHRNFVRIDMENSPFTTATLATYYRLRRQGLENVGTVLQSALIRSEADLAELDRWRANLRIVKGAYKEPPDVAYPRKADVDEAFTRIVARRLRAGLYTAVATHERIIAFTQALADREGIGRERFEFQMLYGVRMQRQEELAREGYRVRCYVPYGEMWYPYFVRRIAESPQNAFFVLRSLFRR